MKLEIGELAGDEDRLRGRVEILGVEHHLTLIRVRDDGGEQRGATEANEGDLESLWSLHPHYFPTVSVPGYPGDYVCYLHPR